MDTRKWIIVALDTDASFAIERFSGRGFKFTVCPAGQVKARLEKNEPAAILYRAVAYSHASELYVKKWKKTRPVTQIVAHFDSSPGARPLVTLMRSGCCHIWTTDLDQDIDALFNALAERIRFVQIGRLERLQLKQEHRQVGLVGDSAEWYSLFRELKTAAASSVPILIGGETGTGKSMIARAIHALSDRNGRPFVTVDCGCLAADLAESELFGSKRGAFTGARSDRLGLLSAAEGGTLFLDEIGELPLALQPKPLRVLEDGELRPVGGATSRRVNIRVISATNRNVDSLVESGHFRSDLYFRINHRRIDLPRLRDRREDIEPLALAFAARHSIGGLPVQVDANTLCVLKEYPWPGNVRELKAVIDAAAVDLPTNCLTLQHLPEKLMGKVAETDVGGFRAVSEDEVIPLRILERIAIEKALMVTNRDISRTAELLGIGRRTLYRRLRHTAELANATRPAWASATGH